MARLCILETRDCLVKSFLFPQLNLMILGLALRQKERQWNILKREEMLDDNAVVTGGHDHQLQIVTMIIMPTMSMSKAS